MRDNLRETVKSRIISMLAERVDHTAELSELVEVVKEYGMEGEAMNIIDELMKHGVLTLRGDKIELVI